MKVGNLVVIIIINIDNGLYFSNKFISRKPKYIISGMNNEGEQLTR